MIDQVTLLVVEDEALIRMDVVDQLESEGFRVLEASTADEAISILGRDATVRIVLTDIDMPGSMDGLKLAAAVRDRWPPIQIIVMSGHRTVEITDMPDGSVFFSKPYRHAIVMDSVNQMLA